ncbi:Protein required for attachment to host cells [Cupriavidus sp. H18C1]|uniref:host attachment protein n=1 Tax=Cupriavidus sp. H18C1 TaxID=3241601 RepID=UPI003BB94F1A
MKTTWVLVADEAIARILEGHKPGQELACIDELTDAGAHADAADLRRDAYGRRAGAGAGPGAGPAVGGGTGRQRAPSSVTSSAGEDELHLEAEGFARRVAEHLADALQKQRYDELRIAAAPRFLGLLRKHLPAQVANVVTEEVDKDLVHLPERELTERLFAAKFAGDRAGGQSAS